MGLFEIKLRLSCRRAWRKTRSQSPATASIKTLHMNIEIRNRHGEKLDYAFHPSGKESAHLVVIGHGVTANKDRPFITALALGLASAGIPTLRFSYSGNGASEGQFTESTISKEVEDLGVVLDAVAGKIVTYIGHSMGGAVGVLRASRDERIRHLVSLGGMVHTKDFARREFGEVTPNAGFMWDKPDCPLSQTFVDDMAKVDSVLSLAGKIQVPWLLIHGDVDDVVPVAESREMIAKANPALAKLIELPGVDHVFSDEGMAGMSRAVSAWLMPFVFTR